MISRRGLQPFLEGALGKRPPQTKILSVGAGGDVGTILWELSETNRFSLIEIDIDDKRSPDVVADICSYRPYEKFDIVVLCEVLEHIKDPEKAITNILCILSPGGMLIGSTPFLFPIHDGPHDYWRFTRFQLTHMLSDFDSVEITEKSGFAETILMLTSRAVKADNFAIRGMAIIINLAVLVAWPIAWLVDRAFPSRFAPIGYWFTAFK